MITNIQSLRRLGPFGLLLLASAVLPLVGSAVLLAYTPEVEPHLRAAGFAGLVAFALATAVLCGLALMNTQVLALRGLRARAWPSLDRRGLDLVPCTPPPGVTASPDPSWPIRH